MEIKDIYILRVLVKTQKQQTAKLNHKVEIVEEVGLIGFGIL